MDDRHFPTSGTISVAAALLIVSALLMITPLNLFGGNLPTPVLPLIVIFLYGLDRPGSLPPALTFGTGLMLDLLFGAALGPWACVLLFTHALIIWQRSYFAGRDTVVLTTGFGIAAMAGMFFFWIIMSIVMQRVLPLGGVFFQTLVTVLLFPLCLMVFRRTIGRQRPSMVA